MSSSLSSLFNRGLLGGRCKTCLNLAISRIKLLRNRREVQLAHMRKEIAQFLHTGQEAIARIRVEHVIREQNILAAYEVVELFCEFVLARVPVLDTKRTCPTELQEAVASIIFAAPRCSDVQELMQIRNLFLGKYGKEFVAAASELRPDCGVNRVIIEKLSVKAPPGDVKLAVLKGISQEYNVDWDSSATEAEFNKKHEDLLDGVNPMNASNALQNSSSNPIMPKLEGTVKLERQNGVHSPKALNPAASAQLQAHPIRVTCDDAKPISNQESEIQECGSRTSVLSSGSDALERARAAMASADRACAAARAAANLTRSITQLGTARRN